MAASMPVHKYFLATRAEPSSTDESITITTIDQDRDGDTVLPEGGDFSDFAKNPILLWSHGSREGYGAIPIGTVTGLHVEPGVGVKASFRFLENDPFADRVANAYRQNVIRASSIGFKPIKATPNGKGVDHEKWQLLELSLCSIPANPHCIRELKAFGLTDEEASPPMAIDPVEEPLIKSEPLPEPTPEPEVVTKRGRVLSSVNESRLRAAVTALSDATRVLDEVLGQLRGSTPEEPDEEAVEVVTLTAPLDEEARYSLALAEEALMPSGFRLMLADEAEDATITLVDDRGREPTFTIDPAVMRVAISEAVKEQMQQALVEPIGESVRRALDRARGRVT